MTRSGSPRNTTAGPGTHHRRAATAETVRAFIEELDHNGNCLHSGNVAGLLGVVAIDDDDLSCVHLESPAPSELLLAQTDSEGRRSAPTLAVDRAHVRLAGGAD